MTGSNEGWERGREGRKERRLDKCVVISFGVSSSFLVFLLWEFFFFFHLYCSYSVLCFVVCVFFVFLSLFCLVIVFSFSCIYFLLRLPLTLSLYCILHVFPHFLQSLICKTDITLHLPKELYNCTSVMLSSRPCLPPAGIMGSRWRGD